MRRALALAVLSVLMSAAPAGADLIDLGDGTIFSTDLGLAFLRDMNTAQTMGYDANGRMGFDQGKAWVAYLNETAYLGYTNWEMAGRDSTNAPLLQHLFYSELQNTPGNWESFNWGPFINGASGMYWTGPGEREPGWAGTYDVQRDWRDLWPTGVRSTTGTYYELGVTATRVVGVPEPSTLLALILGLPLARLCLRRHTNP